MTTKEIAAKLADYCRRAEWEKAQKELYADDAVSIEPYETPDFAKETKGKQAIVEKGRKFTDMTVEMHSLEVSEPMIAENSFAFRMEMDITTKGHGRMKMPELCVYQVKDGKITSEQFFV
jgi:ketosteroid isomerase-like protein